LPVSSRFSLSTESFLLIKVNVDLKVIVMTMTAAP